MDPRQTVQSRIEDIAQCPVCNEVLQDARFLPCGHTFCQGCIEECLRHQLAVNGIKYCPMCRRDLSTLSIDRLWELPRNFMASDISEVLTTLEENELMGDGIGDSTNQASISEDGAQPGSNILMRTFRRLGTIASSFIRVVILFVAVSSKNVMKKLWTTVLVIDQHIGLTSALWRTWRRLGKLWFFVLFLVIFVAGSTEKDRKLFSTTVSVIYQPIADYILAELHKERESCSSELLNYGLMEVRLTTQVKDLKEKRKQDSLEIRRLEKYIDELQFPYDPALTKTFELEPAESRAVVALTLIDGKLLIANSINGDLKLRDAYSVNKETDWATIPSSTVAGMGLCRKNGHVFVSTWNKYIFIFDRNGQLLDQWPVETVASGVISVTDDCNVVLAVRDNSKKILIYSTYGEIISEVEMKEDILESRLIKAVQISNGHFLVSYGEGDDPVHGIAIINANGQTIKSYGNRKGADIGQLKFPRDFVVDRFGNVLVADSRNWRILLLNSELKFQRVLVSTKHGLQQPFGILLNECETLLYVADNQWKPRTKKWTNGRILVYRMK